MSVRKLLSSFLVFLSLQFTLKAQETEDFFTIYLVRHAEKEILADIPSNPSLSECGMQRAESLAIFLEEVDLDAIYSTDYVRTKSTAQPTAKMQDIEVDIYDPKKLKDFAKSLIKRKEDALVVGHSNTTGVLAGLLTGEEIGSFDESIYNRIYQVVVCKKTCRLHILHTGFKCDN